MTFLNSLFSRLKYRIRNIGKMPLCNLCVDRAPHLGSFVFPLCYRCTGLIIGGVFSFYVKIDATVSILLFIPMIIDYLLQYFTNYQSNNFKRFVSGFMFGLGLGIFQG